MQAGLSTKNAPSPSVVLPHYAFGAIVLVVASILMFFGAKDLTLIAFGPKILAITHLLILGWVTIIIYGALYQLIPVVMEVKLYNENLAYISFASMAIGMSMLIYGFWNTYIAANNFVEIGGSLVILSVLLFVINAVGSALKSTNRGVENRFIVTSIVWLLLTVLLGITIILNPIFNLIPRTNFELLEIHLGFGLIGWFLMLVIGVASTLLPMFFIAHKLNKKFLNYSYILLNSGLVLFSIALYFKLNMIITGAFILLMIAGILLFVRYNYDAYKKRLRRKLDIGMKLTVFAFPFLFLALIFGVLSIIDVDPINKMTTQFRLAFGISLILGFFTSLILGQMYKTLPFIVWLQRYQDKVGKFKIPLPNDIYSEKIADYHYYSFAVAIISLLIGVLSQFEIIIQISAFAFFVTALLFSINTFKIIFHKENAEPLTPITPLKK